jgi:hypothetical protein
MPPERNQADGEGDQEKAVNDGDDSDCPRVTALPWTKNLHQLCVAHTAHSGERALQLVSAGAHRVDLEHLLHKRMMSMRPPHFDAKLIDVGRFMIHRVRRYDVFMASWLPTRITGATGDR